MTVVAISKAGEDSAFDMLHPAHFKTLGDLENLKIPHTLEFVNQAAANIRREAGRTNKLVSEEDLLAAMVQANQMSAEVICGRIQEAKVSFLSSLAIEARIALLSEQFKAANRGVLTERDEALLKDTKEHAIRSQFRAPLSAPTSKAA